MTTLADLDEVELRARLVIATDAAFSAADCLAARTVLESKDQKAIQLTADYHAARRLVKNIQVALRRDLAG